MKNLKTLAAALILAGAFSSAPAFASHCVTCPPDDWTNGPSLDGIVQPQSIKTCTKNCDSPDPNGPSLDGLAQPQGIRTCTKTTVECADPNGPSLDGLAQPQGIRTCTKNSAECAEPNGPSLDGLAISEPTDTLPR